MLKRTILFVSTIFFLYQAEIVPFNTNWVEELPQGWIRSFPEEDQIPSSKNHPNAGAIYLLDEDILYLFDKTQVKVVIMKILNRRGYEYAEITTPIYGENESVEIRGRTKKKDGSVVELKNNDIHEVSIYANLKKKKFSLPAIEDDCIIHYEIVYHSDRYPLVGIRYFQNDEPTLLSKFSLILPKALQLVYHDSPPGIIDTTKDVVTAKSSPVSLHTFSKRDLPALETEPFMPPSFEYLPSLAYSISASGGKVEDPALRSEPSGSKTKGGEELKASWENISKWYFETVEKKFKPDGDIKKVAKSLAKGCENAEEKLEKIFYFVEENFKINFPSRFVFDETKRVFDRRNGTSAEVSGVLYAMLKAVDIKGTPVLVPDRKKVSKVPDIPMLDWFDHLILRVNLAHQEIWLDPSYETNKIGHIAEIYQGVDALLIQKSNGKLIKTPSTNYLENLRTCITDMKLAEGGKINCAVIETYSAPRSARLKNHLKGKNMTERSDELAEEISRYCPGALLDTSHFADLYDFDSDFNIFYKFHSPYYVIHADEMLYINPNILHRDETAKEFSQPTRIFPIMFDQVKMDIDSVNMIIPSAYQIISLPEPISLKNDFGEFSTQYQVEDGLIIYKRRLAIRKLLIPSSSHKEVKSFFNQVFEEDQKTIILKKKE
ncbi:MAG: hypothetical protein AMJ73_06705 [candidate division Zixibacteria bacterium SM1_73]|nr:MAG: hypothetical protein AMJ73_06705 [candidate division Zixibacteria bacterium SM1_73]